MSLPIEDYALIGDCHTVALVAKNGSIDWLCVPRFDSPACFAGLLGTEDHGRWRIAPQAAFAEDEMARGTVRVARRYVDHTLILETVFTTGTGEVAVIDLMPPRDGPSSCIVRTIEGRRGTVAMRSEIAVRFNYGETTPWVTSIDDGRGIHAIAGPDKVLLRGPIVMHGEGMKTVADFDVSDGDRLVFVLSHQASHLPDEPPCDVEDACARTFSFWEDWGRKPLEAGPYTDIVKRSLMVLKALTYAPTGGMVAAATTSLPEWLGSVRNWDYRYCWLRDAAFTLFALMNSGYYDEARDWRLWLERAIAGDAKQLRIMYGLAGERRLVEYELDWLPGYADSRPVRVGNAASNQLQLDVYGQVMAAIHFSRLGGLTDDADIWSFQLKMLEHLETIWQEPDYSIWETRDGALPFTFSKVMVWTAFDRAIQSAEKYGFEGPVERWRDLRSVVHAEICECGFHVERNAFVQSYGSDALDASLLLIPLVGFLPWDDPRVLGTVAAIESDLVVDGLVLRYRTDETSDGLPPGEGVFLACSFWLVDNLRLQGRIDEATGLFEHLLAIANDVGLLAEEYDPIAKRQLGNFPQAFSHVSLINSALGLARAVTMGDDSQQAGDGSDATIEQPALAK